MDVARPDQDLLVVTENGFGKRTAIDDYPIKGRGTMGVKTIALTDKKGALAAALVVREHEELVFISTNGMVQRTGVRGINRYGRASQGVKVMNMKEDDTVSRRRAGHGVRRHRRRRSTGDGRRWPTARRSSPARRAPRPTGAATDGRTAPTPAPEADARASLPATRTERAAERRRIGRARRTARESA